jgi:acyl carrier protein
MQNPDAFAVVKNAVESMSRELGYPALGEVSADTPLYGDASGLDSLSLVMIVASIERAAEQHFRRHVVLADDRAMSRRNSPFRTVGTLAELLDERLAE